MRKGVMFLAPAIAAAVLMCGCQSVMFSPEVDGLLAKMRKAKDPAGVLARAKTKTITGTFRTSTKDQPMKMTLRFKKPDKMRVDVDTPDGKFVKACDGKTAWSFSSKTGLKVLKGQPLYQTRLQALLLSPGMKLANIFESIKLVGTDKVADRSCYKFVCQPKKSFHSRPITFYVDKETMLVVERDEKLYTVKGRVLNAKTFFNGYESANGVMMPKNIITYADGDVAEFNVDSIEWDENVNNSTFDLPKKM